METFILATTTRYVRVESHIDWEKTLLYSLVATGICIAISYILNEISKAQRKKRKKK